MKRKIKMEIMTENRNNEKNIHKNVNFRELDKREVNTILPEMLKESTLRTKEEPREDC